MIASVSDHSPSAPAMIEATIRIQMTRARNWSRNRHHAETGGFSMSRLGPY